MNDSLGYFAFDRRDDDDEPKVEENLDIMMTKNLDLVVGCPIEGCVFGVVLPTAWESLPTIMELRRELEPHLQGAHEGDLGWDNMVDGFRHFPSLVAAMRAQTLADLSPDKCWRTCMLEGNMESGGIVRYVMKERALATPDSSVYGGAEFDQFWADLEEHGKNELQRIDARGRVVKDGVAEFLKILHDDGDQRP